MATREIAIYDETFEAASNLTQYRGVGFSSTGTMGHGGNIIGVAQDAPQSGQAVQVRLQGITRHEVNGSGTPIAIGSPITGALGVVATAGQLAHGVALQASTTNGDVIAVLMTGPFRVHA